VSTFSEHDRAARGRSLSSWASPPLAFLLALSLGVSLPMGRAGAQPGADAPARATPSNPQATDAAPTPGAAAPLAESLSGTARADYAAARILYEDGDYAGAFTKLDSAYATSKDPRLLWNMAACEKALRHYASVIDLLERYLKESAALIGPEEHRATRELVDRVRGFVNELRLDVQPTGVDVLVDGVKQATTPLQKPLWVDMGKRRLRFEKAGFVPQENELELRGGTSIDLKIELLPEIHQGTLRVLTDPRAVISIDGHVVGTGTWIGQLPSGAHAVHLSAEGKQPRDTEVVIKDRDTSSLQMNLVDEQRGPGLYAKDSSSGALWWIVGGVALAGAGVGSYFLLRPGDGPSQPESGTLGLRELP
jgi:PEGA domain